MSWFKRIKEGITTSTRQKKKLLKDFGTNVLNVKKSFLLKIIKKIILFVHIVITMKEYHQMNT